MPVYPDSGPSLGESLVRGVSAFMQARRDAEDRRLGRRRAEMQAIAGGYRPGAPPTSYVDAPVMTPDDLSKAFHVNAATLANPATDQRRQAADDFTANLADAFMNRRPSQPAIALAKANNFHVANAARGQARDLLGPGADDKDVSFVAKLARLANAPSMAPAPQSGGFVAPSGTMRLPTTDPRYVPISDKAGGGYVDTPAGADAQFERMIAESNFKQRQRADVVDRYVAAGVPRERAELYADNGALAQNDPILGRRTPDQLDVRTPRSFMLDGKPVAGFVDRAGKFYGADGQPVAGNITPYVAPQQPRQPRPSSMVSGNIRAQFNGDQTFKDAQQIATAYQKIRAAAMGRHTATSDMSLVYGLMKMQDPGSTVREGEYASAENAKGIPDRIRNLYNKVLDGAILSDNQRTQFLQTASSIAQAQRGVFQGTLRRYSAIAERAGIDPGEIVFDPFDGLELDASGKTPVKTPVRSNTSDPGGNIDLRSENPFMTLPRRTP